MSGLIPTPTLPPKNPAPNEPVDVDEPLTCKVCKTPLGFKETRSTAFAAKVSIFVE